MLQPQQFEVDEAWIVFRLNDEPLRTDHDGDFNFFALMDAASCFIVSSTPVPATRMEPDASEAERMLREGHAHHHLWPKRLFIPSGQPAQYLVSDAERLGIEVVRVPEADLLPVIGEALESFRERFGTPGGD